MHASIWRFAGDPQQLLDSYQAILRDIPAANMRLHLCGATQDGIVVVDTCPSQAAFDGFVAAFAELRRRHGLPEPVAIDDFAVTAAFADGQRLSSAS
jgi:hypothetical protein